MRRKRVFAVSDAIIRYTIFPDPAAEGKPFVAKRIWTTTEWNWNATVSVPYRRCKVIEHWCLNEVVRRGTVFGREIYFFPRVAPSGELRRAVAGRIAIRIIIHILTRIQERFKLLLVWLSEGPLGTF